MNLLQLLAQIKNNPSAFLSRYGLPNADPQSLIQRLMNDGKITQEQYNSAVRQAQSMGFKV